jgi:hypothetical protein
MKYFLSITKNRNKPKCKNILYDGYVLIILQWWKLHIAFVVAFDSVRLPPVHVKLAMMKLPCLLDFKMLQ